MSKTKKMCFSRPVLDYLAGVRNHPNPPSDIVDRLLQAAKDHEGRRRLRTIFRNRILQGMYALIDHPKATTVTVYADGWVARAYKYYAPLTAVTFRRLGEDTTPRWQRGMIEVTIHTVDARKPYGRGAHLTVDGHATDPQGGTDGTE